MSVAEYDTYPVNGTVAMQQAWRLYFDKDLKRGESYLIKKNHPKECHEMFGRSLVADGSLSEQDLNEEQLSYIEQKFIDLLDFTYQNPKISFTASCVYIGGMTTAIVFFCRYISHQGFS